jgi:hypothetical protein
LTLATHTLMSPIEVVPRELHHTSLVLSTGENMGKALKLDTALKKMEADTFDSYLPHSASVVICLRFVPSKFTV